MKRKGKLILEWVVSILVLLLLASSFSFLFKGNEDKVSPGESAPEKEDTENSIIEDIKLDKYEIIF